MPKAKLKIYGFDDLEATFNAIGEAAVPAAKAAVYAGANVLANEVRSKLEQSLSGESNGDLENALGIASIGEEKGIINTRVSFDGYDRNGTPNPLKANVLNAGRKLESGTSYQRPRPFMRPAVRAARGPASEAMAEAFDAKMRQIRKG